MKSPLLLFTLQEMLFEILLSAGVFPCNEFLSSNSFSKVILAMVIMVESSVYGFLTAWVYIHHPVVKLRQEVMTRI